MISKIQDPLARGLFLTAIYISMLLVMRFAITFVKGATISIWAVMEDMLPSDSTTVYILIYPL